MPTQPPTPAACGIGAPPDEPFRRVATLFCGIPSDAGASDAGAD